MKNTGGTKTDSIQDKTATEDKSTVFLLHEIELLLSEKRTALSVMRTGIAIIALPLSVFSVLIATSRFYEISDVIHFLVLVFGISFFLIGLSVYLIVKSLKRLHMLDRLISDIKKRSSLISDLVTWDREQAAGISAMIAEAGLDH